MIISIQLLIDNDGGCLIGSLRRDCEVVSSELNASGIPSVAYHAGLMDEERSAVQNKWVRDTNCKVSNYMYLFLESVLFYLIIHSFFLTRLYVQL